MGRPFRPFIERDERAPPVFDTQEGSCRQCTSEGILLAPVISKTQKSSPMTGTLTL